MNANPYSPENYIHNILPNVLISTDDDPITIFKLALSLTRQCTQTNNTVQTVLGEKCLTVDDAVKAVKAMADGNVREKLCQEV